MTDSPPPLVGYQAVVSWMGVDVLTLDDLWPEDPRAMIVGLNPAPLSVAVGHYYQGKVGRRQMDRLAQHGLFVPSHDGYVERGALAAGIGFSDLVKRPTVGENGVDSAELAHGRRLLDKALAERGIGLVICVFRHPVEALLGVAEGPGFQSRRTSWGARVFRMPGPFDPRETVASVMHTLTVD